MADKDAELITVYEAGSSGGAYLVRDMLLDNDIEAVVSGEYSEAAPVAPITDGPTVQVRTADRDQALKLIQEFERETIHDEDETAQSTEPPWTCPKCGETVDGNFEVCWNCEAERPEADPSAS